MKASRDKAFEYVFTDEGGYAERPEEAGGAVNMGITFDVFAAWWKLKKAHGAPTWADLKAMSQADARAIYDYQFLAAIKFDDLPGGVDYAVLDSAINNGIGGATKFLREALGFKGKDINTHFDAAALWGAKSRIPKELVDRFCDIRLAKQKRFKLYAQPIKAGSTKTWGQVWDARVEKVRKRAYGLLAVSGKPPVASVVTPAPVRAPAWVMTPAAVAPGKTASWAGGFDGKCLSPAQFDAYVQRLAWSAWKPQFVVLHNSGAPTLKAWMATPGGESQRIKNLEHYYRDQQKWKSGPHLFISPAGIFLGTPLTVPGTHSPSWNKTSIGIEMAGDYDREPFDARVRANTIAAIAAIYRALGLKPDTIRLHKQDPKTTHKNCPGKNVSLADIVAGVTAALA